MKKKILFVYPEMMMGGSTSNLIALLNGIDPQKYTIDLLLYRKKGELLDGIPDHIRIVDNAEKYVGVLGKIIKILVGIFGGALIKARLINKAAGRKGFSKQILADFQADNLSRTLHEEYDYAIGGLEGWPDRYVANKVLAHHKYAWLHSSFKNIADIPALEVPWMQKVDRIICVSDTCVREVREALPEVSDKLIKIENIVDDELIIRQSKIIPSNSKVYDRWKNYVGFKIITVCRISIETKGLDRIVRCARKLKDDGYEFLWCIVGGGVQTPDLAEMIAKDELEQTIILAGSQKNPYPFMVEADIYCMPSRHEGKPITVTESMILGVPPVVTEYVSAHEQINDENNGVIVDNSDYSIMSPIMDFIQNKDKLRKMKNELKKTRFGNKEYIKQIEDYLLE